ncbi:unnamed protein product [Agarophyton chilense]
MPFAGTADFSGVPCTSGEGIGVDSTTSIVEAAIGVGRAVVEEGRDRGIVVVGGLVTIVTGPCCGMEEGATTEDADNWDGGGGRGRKNSAPTPTGRGAWAAIMDPMENSSTMRMIDFILVGLLRTVGS